MNDDRMQDSPTTPGVLSIANPGPSSLCFTIRPAQPQPEARMLVKPSGEAFINGNTTPATDAEMGAFIRTLAMRMSEEYIRAS